MIKKACLLLFVSLLSVSARVVADNWNVFPSYHNATHCEVAGKKVYVLASGALFSYNTEDNEVITYDKLNMLSDVDISNIAYCEKQKALVIVYSNANIDILYDDETVYNISDFKNINLSKKGINGIDIYENRAYLSTEFGVVVVDLEKLQINDSYNLGINTLTTSLFKNNLYIGTENGILRCDTAKNMLDKNNWEKMNYGSRTDAICELNGELYFLNKTSGIHKLDVNNNKYTTVVNKSGKEYHTIYNKENTLIAPALDKVTIIGKDKKITTYNTDNCNFAYKKGENYWICKGYKGVYQTKANNNTLTTVTEISIPDSPVRNYCEFLKFANEEKLLVAGGNINYMDITFYDATLMEYNINDRKWFNFPEDIVKSTTKLNYRNICSIDEDPNEEGHYFASSFGNGVFEFRNGEFVKQHNHKNSIIESVIPNVDNNCNYNRVPYVKFDKEGNLWCINTGVKNIVKVRKKDGTWISLNYKDIEYFETMAQPLLDSRGWIWITSLRKEAGLFCAKLKGTPFDTKDDETNVWTSKFTNQDGTSYVINEVYPLIEDKKGELWVGTSAGLFVIDNPEEFFKNSIFKQIKVPRNDGTGLADYLMNGMYIKAIAVDGANRKWIGTLDNGVYLVSDDGLETIHHFTTENSPLPSNYIESIAVNEKTGEVFIGTANGIASYRSDATRAEEKLEKSEIYAYPNPVRPGYNGDISIVGLTDNCNIKIVDGAGYLINEGYSNGGMYCWNGRDIRGEKVASGVYYVLLYDETGKEGEVAKILITR